MILDTADAFTLIAEWDKWSGNGYAKLNYPSVSISSASHMLGGAVRASGLTDEDGAKIDAALAKVSKLSETMFKVTFYYVRTKGNASAVEKETGVSRKAVPVLAKTGLEVCGEYIRNAFAN
jgi:hypothetical protein